MHHSFSKFLSYGVTAVFSSVNLATPEQGALDGDARGCSVGLNARIHACMQQTDHRSLDVCISISYYTVTPERVPFRDNSNLYKYS
jgi:hypothetical protein